MQVPYRYYRSFAGSTVIMPDGSEVPSRSVEYLRYAGFRNDFGKMRGILESQGDLETTMVGPAQIMMTTTRDIFKTAVEYLEGDIGFLLTDESKQLLSVAPDGCVDAAHD
jgi:hypothetical protein